jgi:ATPase subunit of ABC transporter with duplicated ATPase domains
MSKTFIEVKNLTKYYGGLKLFEDISFKVNHGEKVGLTGKNGCGKSTLLKVIKGIEKADSGNVRIIPESARLGYLPQSVVFDEDTASEVLKNAALEAGFEEYWEMQKEINKVVSEAGLKDCDVNLSITNLSGGEKTRLFLAKILMLEPDFLLLDEPTNFLDIKALKWIEEFIRTREQGVLMVSHDRYFLDRTVDRIIEIEEEKTFEYSGNYSSYRRQKEELREKRLKTHTMQKDEIRRLRGLSLWHKQIQRNINDSTVNDSARGAAEVHTRAAKSLESRIRRIENEIVQKPRRDYMAKIRFDGSSSSRTIANVQDFKKAYGNKLLYSGVNFTISAGEKVGILGENGTGKTTLLRILQGLETPDSGKVFLKTDKTSYFSQIFEELNPDNTVIDEMTAKTGIALPEARQLLAGFLFIRDTVFKKVSNLSIGERSRLALACIKSHEPEVLILDEPTCHLDVDTTELLEKALKDYAGTIIIITHDRLLLDNLVERLLVIENQTIADYRGNYTYYANRDKEESCEDLPAQQNKLLLELRISEISGKLSRGDLSDEDRNKLENEFYSLKNELKSIVE